MNCRAHLHTIALLLGVVLALSATAEEHKAAAPAATAAAAPKEETPAAPAKVALKTEAPSKVALKTEALAAAAVASKVAANVATKQSELLAAIDRTKLAVPTPPAVPRHQRVKVSKNSGLQHVALTSAGAKPDAHGALATTPEGAAAPRAVCGALRKGLSSTGHVPRAISSISDLMAIIASQNLSSSSSPSLSVGSTISVPATGKDMVGAWKP